MIMKVDVECFEPQMIKGAQKMLAAGALPAVLIESDYPAVHANLLSSGFQKVDYDLHTRRVIKQAGMSLAQNHL